MLFVLIISLAIGAHADGEEVQSLESNMGTCLADTIVLEGILLRISAELATGILIPKAIQEIKFFLSLIPEWFKQCESFIPHPHSKKDSSSEESSPVHIGDSELETRYGDCLSLIEESWNLFENTKDIGVSMNYEALLDLTERVNDIANRVKDMCR